MLCCTVLQHYSSDLTEKTQISKCILQVLATLARERQRAAKVTNSLSLLDSRVADSTSLRVVVERVYQVETSDEDDDRNKLK